MKKLVLTTFVVFFSVCYFGIQGQTTQPQINQLELWNQTLGVWRADYGKDTIEVWDCKRFGNAFIITSDLVIKGQKSPQYVNNISFSTKEGKFYGFGLFASGGRNTWTGSFITEKVFKGELSTNYDPGKIWGKLENTYENPNAFTFRMFNADGVMTSELKFKKVK